MNHPKDDPVRMICGMTEPTARRYMVIRKELDMIIARVHKAAYWLSEFEKAKADGLCQTLTLMGLSIMHSMSQIYDYLESEFVSLESVSDAVNDRKK
jgi:hypothetical protein